MYSMHQCLISLVVFAFVLGNGAGQVPVPRRAGKRPAPQAKGVRPTLAPCAVEGYGSRPPFRDEGCQFVQSGDSYIGTE